MLGIRPQNKKDGKNMRSDIEIAPAAQMQPITQVAAKVGLGEDDISLYG